MWRTEMFLLLFCKLLSVTNSNQRNMDLAWKNPSSDRPCHSHHRMRSPYSCGEQHPGEQLLSNSGGQGHSWDWFWLFSQYQQGSDVLEEALHRVSRMEPRMDKGRLRAVPGHKEQSFSVASKTARGSKPTERGSQPPVLLQHKGDLGQAGGEKHHGVTTSLWVVHWEPQVGCWGGHKAPERASPRQPDQAAGESSSPCQEKPLRRGL